MNAFPFLATEPFSLSLNIIYMLYCIIQVITTSSFTSAIKDPVAPTQHAGIPNPFTGKYLALPKP